MISDISIYENGRDINYCVITLPGRAGHGDTIADFYAHSCGLEETVFVGLTPENYYWYPLPVSATNQEAAVAGLPHARFEIEKAISIVRDKYGIPKERTALVGFSAGGVMAIQVAAYSDEPYAAVVSHSGAILEPKDLPPCKHETTAYVLIQCKDDMCFAWDERYLPMKRALLENGYDTFSLEHPLGGHGMSEEDIRQAGKFMSSWMGAQCFHDDDLIIEACSLDEF